MISADVRLEGFDARSWANLVSLFLPRVKDELEAAPERSDAPLATDADTSLRGDGETRAAPFPDSPGPRQGTLFIVRTPDGRVLHALHSKRGRVPVDALEGSERVDSGGPDAAEPDRAFPALRPEDLADRHRARRVVLLQRGALEELSERLALRLQRGDDYLTQWLTLARTFREVQEAGMVQVWPRPLANVPIPPTGAVRAALDLMLPDDHAAVAVLWDRGRPWTAVVLRRRHGAIDFVAGPDLLARWTGPLGGDWRRDTRVIVDAVSRAVAPTHLGLFAEVQTIEGLLRHPDPGAWARAVTTRDVLVHPTPPYVAVALGADGVRGLADRSARWLGGIDALAPFAPLTSYVRSRVSEARSLTDTLGFNPLKALAIALDSSDDDDDAVREDGGAGALDGPASPDSAPDPDGKVDEPDPPG